MNLAQIKRNPRAAAQGMTLGELRKLLQKFDYEYHDQNKPSVDDKVYDTLRDVHDERAKKPYARVGSKSTHAARRTKLAVAMGSLSKLKPGSSGLLSFLEKGPFVVSDKEDGISLQLVYQNHVLVKAVQRGDGKIGTDSSGVIPALKVPHRVKAKDLIVRVEFTMSQQTFDRHFSKENGGEYDNPRNGAGGLLNRNQPTTAITKIKCIAHEIMAGPNARVAPSKQFAYLKAQGFDVVPHKVYPKLNETILTNLLNIRRSRAKRAIDGIVVAQDRSYTVVGKYPTHAFAFKINDLNAAVEVPVLDVEFNESRYGRLAPRILIKPTRIGGVMVEHFTGHNGFYIEHGYTSKLKGSKIPYAPRPINKGAIIKCVRSGDVIPYIVEVVKAAKKPAQPSVPFESDGVHYYATEGGDDRKAKALLNFFTALEVDGLKRGTIDVLIANGFTTIKKIINATAADFEEIPRFGHTKAVTLERNIRNSLAKNATLAKLGAGSVLFGDKFGESRLSELFKALPDIVYSDMSEREMVAAIQDIRGFKELAVTAAKVMPKFRLFLKKLGVKVVQPKKIKVLTSGVMAGKSILFTSVRDKALAEWIVANGGKLASSAKSANLLVVKDKYASNNKVDYANDNGIPVMPVDEFRTKFKVP